MCINGNHFLFSDSIVIFGTNKIIAYEEIYYLAGESIPCGISQKEVVKEYKWIPLDGKITGNIVIERNVLIEGNVEVTGNVIATGYITARGTDSDIIALYERNN